MDIKEIFLQVYWFLFGTSLMAFNVRNNVKNIFEIWLATNIGIIIGLTIYHSIKYFFIG